MKNFKNLFLILIACVMLTKQISALNDYWRGADLDLAQKHNQMILFDRVSQSTAPIQALENWLHHPEYLTASRNYMGETPMHLVARRGFDSDLDLAIRLRDAGLVAGVNLLDVTDDVGRTPLFLAVTIGEAGNEMVQRLIELGANVNLSDDRGRLPLDEAQDSANLGSIVGADNVILLSAAGAHHSADYGRIPIPGYMYGLP